MDANQSRRKIPKLDTTTTSSSGRTIDAASATAAAAAAAKGNYNKKMAHKTTSHKGDSHKGDRPVVEDGGATVEGVVVGEQQQQQQQVKKWTPTSTIVRKIYSDTLKYPVMTLCDGIDLLPALSQGFSSMGVAKCYADNSNGREHYRLDSMNILPLFDIHPVSKVLGKSLTFSMEAHTKSIPLQRSILSTGLYHRTIFAVIPDHDEFHVPVLLLQWKDSKTGRFNENLTEDIKKEYLQLSPQLVLALIEKIPSAILLSLQGEICRKTKKYVTYTLFFFRKKQ